MERFERRAIRIQYPKFCAGLLNFDISVSFEAENDKINRRIIVTSPRAACLPEKED